MNFKIDSRLMFECFDILNEVSRRYRVTLLWTADHRGIEENKILDMFKNHEAEKKFIGSELYYCFDQSFFQEWLKGWEARQNIDHVNTLGANSQFRSFISYSEDKTKSLLRQTGKIRCRLYSISNFFISPSKHKYIK